MTYEAGFFVFAFVAFCAVVVYALYRRALVVDDAAHDEVLLSRDDVLELTIKPGLCTNETSEGSKIPPRPFHYLEVARPTKVSKKWQPHDTGKMPVDWRYDVVVMFRNGTVSMPMPAKDLRWWSLDVESDADILAYRIV